MEIIKHICDIKECENKAQHIGQTIQVIFTTEQTEGRSTDHYLSSEKIDLCKVHMDFILKGNYIFADGAMGFNSYYFMTSNGNK